MNISSRFGGSRLLRLLAILCVQGAVAAAGSIDPVADPAAVIRSGDARFTILTSRLVRLEWSPGGVFEDRKSLVFLNRRMPVPAWTSERQGGWLIVRTGDLLLRYKEGSGRFTEGNLSMQILPTASFPGRTWRPGMPDTANLLGTRRTLDGVKGATDLEAGLLSRDGWTVVDDSRRPLLDDSSWAWVLPRPEGEQQDLYFFGYRRDYKGLLKDFIQVAGRIPLPPRFAFGTWWSRYWAYTDSELKELVREFRLHTVPLDVLVVDMDWHLTFDMRWDNDVRDQAGQRLGWTGYTWDRTFFPDPPAFLGWCAAQGLKTTLNLHPASGIQPHEEQYPAMARAMGIDPATRRYVPFDIVDRRFTENYLTHVIHPLEDLGVDFWWLDWQQWGTTTIAGVTPTWWLNYVFFTDMERRGRNRPLLFHRWGGLGNHRYQIGFSGDAISVWESLAFQPYFTATAANVGFGYWSHDIGGHMPGPVSPELYTRWIQFGVFSPILRTHTTKNPDSERRMWAYPNAYFTVMRDAFRLRYALIPYIYTEARKAYDTGISLCRPMYFEYPDIPEAYQFPGQYFFGEDMIVAPIASPMDDSQTAVQEIWIPAGEWIEWYTGAVLTGPRVFRRAYTLEEVPVFVRAGGIVPMQPDMLHTGERSVDPLILTLFPGGSGNVRVYEDQGNSNEYRKNECAWTPVRMDRGSDGATQIMIGAREGGYPGMPAERSYEIRLCATPPPGSIHLDGVPLSRVEASEDRAGWWYDGDRATVMIRTLRRDPAVRTAVVVTGQPGATPVTVDGLPGALRRLRKGMDLLNRQWPKEWSPADLISAVQTGNRLSLRPEASAAELGALRSRIDASLGRLPEMSIPDSIRVQAGALMRSAAEYLRR